MESQKIMKIKRLPQRDMMNKSDKVFLALGEFG